MMRFFLCYLWKGNKKPSACYRWLHKLWYTFPIADGPIIGNQARECYSTARAFYLPSVVNVQTVYT